jgi:hypothetical protein
MAKSIIKKPCCDDQRFDTCALIDVPTLGYISFNVKSLDTLVVTSQQRLDTFRFNDKCLATRLDTLAVTGKASTFNSRSDVLRSFESEKNKNTMEMVS